MMWPLAQGLETELNSGKRYNMINATFIEVSFIVTVWLDDQVWKEPLQREMPHFMRS